MFSNNFLHIERGSIQLKKLWNFQNFFSYLLLSRFIMLIIMYNEVSNIFASN